MIRTSLQIEGTWEQIAALGPSLAGHRLRLTVLPEPQDADSSPESELSLAAQFAKIRAENPNAWNALPSDLAEQHDHYIYGWPKK